MPYYLLLLLAGALQGVMVSLNGQLGNYYSPFAICFCVHGIALILLLAYLLATKTPLGFKERTSALRVSRRRAFGIAIVASTSWCTLRIGPAIERLSLAISTAGQVISSQLIDQFGLFGMPVQKFNAKQIPGYVLLAAGVALVVTG
ncbi:MAG: DMT family transporter [Oscillospiraceae bacterium]